MKPSNDSHVTKKDLREELDRFKNEDLKEEFKEFKIEIKEELRDEFEIIADRLDEKNRGYRDQILEKISNFVGRVATLEEENEIGTHQISELKQTVDSHESRLRKIEKSAKN